MKFIEYSEKIEELKNLVETTGTGPPLQLASRLKVLERTLLVLTKAEATVNKNREATCIIEVAFSFRCNRKLIPAHIPCTTTSRPKE